MKTVVGIVGLVVVLVGTNIMMISTDWTTTLFLVFLAISADKGIVAWYHKEER